MPVSLCGSVSARAEYLPHDPLKPQALIVADLIATAVCRQPLQIRPGSSALAVSCACTAHDLQQRTTRDVCQSEAEGRELQAQSDGMF